MSCDVAGLFIYILRLHLGTLPLEKRRPVDSLEHSSQDKLPMIAQATEH